MLNEIKKSIKKFLSIIKFSFYNKRYKTRIRSTSASLKAKYNIGVSIAENTVVTDDVTIGMYSYVNNNSSVENCDIGNYCSISSGVFINPFEHVLYRRSTHPFVGLPPVKREKVYIGNDVLISLNSIILSGVHIGNGAVIAAGAVVTKDVMPFEVVGGVPAKHIKWRFNEEEQKNINKTQWWLNDIAILKNNINYFENASNIFKKD